MVVKVTQTLQSDLGQSFVAKQEIQLSSEIPNEQPDTVDGRKISSIKWIQVPERGVCCVMSSMFALSLIVYSHSLSSCLLNQGLSTYGPDSSKILYGTASGQSSSKPRN